MIYYLQTRAITLDGRRLYSPKNMLKYGFNDLDFKWKCLLSSNKNNTWIYEIDISINDIESLVNGLTLWAAKIIKIDNVVESFKNITKRQDIKIIDKKVYIPNIKSSED